MIAGMSEFDLILIRRPSQCCRTAAAERDLGIGRDASGLRRLAVIR
jgi:hypothetical protein